MHDEASAQQGITSWLDAAPQRQEIELVSHADDSHVLLVGAWRLTRGAFAAAPAALKERLVGRTIVLVGCATGCGREARQALCYLKATFRVSVFGARDLIGTPDLTNAGADPRQRNEDFVEPRCPVDDAPDEYIVKESSLARGGVSREFTREDRSRVFEGLVDDTGERIDSLGDDFLQRTYFVYPGLLQHPSATRTFSTHNELGGSVRVDALFGGQVFRFVRISRGGDRREYLLMTPRGGERTRLHTALGL